jgi:para-aminobenzoate synthetase / 4-amino-4-deoxychorismate lyase
VEPVRIALDGPLTVADVLRAVRDDVRPFALVGRWAGSRAIVGSEPVRVVEGAAVLDVLDEAPAGGGDGVVGGGWFGYLGYGLGAAIERLPPPPPRPAPLPVASLGYYDHVLRQDADGAWWFEALTPEAVGRLDVLRARLGGAERAWRLGPLAPAPGATTRHLAAVAECVERIAAGDLFQANLTLRLEGRLEGSASDAFLAAARELDPPYGAFLGLPGAAVLSFSPERFLRRTGDHVITSPIKGTAPREAGSAALLGSAKDAAEHVMIVDLSRNDLGRVARYGSVAAAERRAEPHPGLWHLVTDVSARVREGTTDAAVVRAAFPPGSVTGAPKVQALKTIAALEGTQREVYTGAIGFASPLAGLELSVAIRTLETRGERAWLGCGGGIVADSNPAAELAEALGKAAPIARALGSRVVGENAAAPNTRGLGVWPTRPDPGAGLLETRCTGSNSRRCASSRPIPKGGFAYSSAPTAPSRSRSTRPGSRPLPSCSSRACWPAGSAATSGSTAPRTRAGSSSTSTGACSRARGPTCGCCATASCSRRPTTAACCPASPARASSGARARVSTSSRWRSWPGRKRSCSPPRSASPPPPGWRGHRRRGPSNWPPSCAPIPHCGPKLVSYIRRKAGRLVAGVNTRALVSETRRHRLRGGPNQRTEIAAMEAKDGRPPGDPG